MSDMKIPERHADTERNMIINRASYDLEQIINGHDPEIHHLGNRVWDRLDKMAVDIENHRSDLCASGQQVMSGNPKMEKSALERLAELRREVTDEPLHVSGRYFNSHSCTDLTRCGYGGTGEFWNPADGKAISILWGLWRDGGFDALTPAPEAAQAEAVHVSPESLTDLIGELGREVYNMLDDCETSGPVGDEVHTITDEALKNVSEILDRIDALPFEVPGVILGPGAMLQEAIKHTFVPPAAPAPGIVEAEAVPVDDRSLQFRIGDIGNQVHNIACEHQDDESLAERLGELRSELWSLAKEVAHPPQPSVSVAEALENMMSFARSKMDDPSRADDMRIFKDAESALRALKGGDHG